MSFSCLSVDTPLPPSGIFHVVSLVLCMTNQRKLQGKGKEFLLPSEPQNGRLYESNLQPVCSGILV